MARGRPVETPLKPLDELIKESGEKAARLRIEAEEEKKAAEEMERQRLAKQRAQANKDLDDKNAANLTLQGFVSRMVAKLKASDMHPELVDESNAAAEQSGDHKYINIFAIQLDHVRYIKSREPKRCYVRFQWVSHLNREPTEIAIRTGIVGATNWSGQNHLEGTIKNAEVTDESLEALVGAAYARINP